MNEDIKEILENIKKSLENNNIEDIATIGYDTYPERWLKLLNYITNLQEENQRLKDEIEEISTSHFILFKRYDKIEKENQKLVKVIDELEKYLILGIDEDICIQGDMYFGEACETILNKLTELKGGSDESLH